jgi:hypothetical protein
MESGDNHDLEETLSDWRTQSNWKRFKEIFVPTRLSRDLIGETKFKDKPLEYFSMGAIGFLSQGILYLAATISTVWVPYQLGKLIVD